MRFAGSHDVIVGSFMLQHEPHRLDIILGASPISSAFKIAKHDFIIEMSRDSGRSARDLASNEILPASWRFMIVKNAVANKQPVRLPVNPGQLGCERLTAPVGAGRKLVCTRFAVFPRRCRKFPSWKRDKIAPGVTGPARFRASAG